MDRMNELQNLIGEPVAPTPVAPTPVAPTPVDTGLDGPGASAPVHPARGSAAARIADRGLALAAVLMAAGLAQEAAARVPGDLVLTRLADLRGVVQVAVNGDGSVAVTMANGTVYILPESHVAVLPDGAVAVDGVVARDLSALAANLPVNIVTPIQLATLTPVELANAQAGGTLPGAAGASSSGPAASRFAAAIEAAPLQLAQVTSPGPVAPVVVATVPPASSFMSGALPWLLGTVSVLGGTAAIAAGGGGDGPAPVAPGPTFAVVGGAFVGTATGPITITFQAGGVRYTRQGVNVDIPFGPGGPGAGAPFENYDYANEVALRKSNPGFVPVNDPLQLVPNGVLKLVVDANNLDFRFVQDVGGQLPDGLLIELDAGAVGVVDTTTLLLDTSGLGGPVTLFFQFQDPAFLGADGLLASGDEFAGDEVDLGAASDLANVTAIFVVDGVLNVDPGAANQPGITEVNSTTIVTAAQFINSSAITSTTGMGKLILRLDTTDLAASIAAIEAELAGATPPLLIGFGAGELFGNFNVEIQSLAGVPLTGPDAPVVNEAATALVAAIRAASLPSLTALSIQFRAVVDAPLVEGLETLRLIGEAIRAIDLRIAGLQEQVGENSVAIQIQAYIDALDQSMTDLVEAEVAALQAALDGLGEDVAAGLGALGEGLDALALLVTTLDPAVAGSVAARLAAMKQDCDDALVAAVENLENRIADLAGALGEGDYATVKALSDALKALQNLVGQDDDAADDEGSVFARLAALDIDLRDLIEAEVARLDGRIDALADDSDGEGAATLDSIAGLRAAVEALQAVFGADGRLDEYGARLDAIEATLANITNPGRLQEAVIELPDSGLHTAFRHDEDLAIPLARQPGIYFAGGQVHLVIQPTALDGSAVGAPVTVSAAMVAGDEAATRQALAQAINQSAQEGLLIGIVGGAAVEGETIILTAAAAGRQLFAVADLRLDYAGVLQQAVVSLDTAAAYEVYSYEDGEGQAIAATGTREPTAVYFGGGQVHLTIIGAGEDGLLGTDDDAEITISAAMGEDAAATLGNLVDVIAAAMGEGGDLHGVIGAVNAVGADLVLTAAVAGQATFAVSDVRLDYAGIRQQAWVSLDTADSYSVYTDGAETARGADVHFIGGQVHLTITPAGGAPVTIAAAMGEDAAATLANLVTAIEAELGEGGDLFGVIGTVHASVGRLLLTAAIPGEQTFSVSDVRLDYEGVRQLATVALDGADSYSVYTDGSATARGPAVYFEGGQVHLTITPAGGAPVTISAAMGEDAAGTLASLITAIEAELGEGGDLHGIIGSVEAGEGASLLLTAAIPGEQTFSVSDVRLDYEGVRQLASISLDEAEAYSLFTHADGEGARIPSGRGPDVYFEGGQVHLTIIGAGEDGLLGTDDDQEIVISAAMGEDGAATAENLRAAVQAAIDGVPGGEGSPAQVVLGEGLAADDVVAIDYGEGAGLESALLVAISVDGVLWYLFATGSAGDQPGAFYAFNFLSANNAVRVLDASPRLGDFVDWVNTVEIDGQLPPATLALVDGQLVVTAREAGPSTLEVLTFASDYPALEFLSGADTGEVGGEGAPGVLAGIIDSVELDGATLTFTAAEPGSRTFAVGDITLDYQGLYQKAFAVFSDEDSAYFEGGQIIVEIQPVGADGAPQGESVRIAADMVAGDSDASLAALRDAVLASPLLAGVIGSAVVQPADGALHLLLVSADTTRLAFRIAAAETDTEGRAEVLTATFSYDDADYFAAADDASGTVPQFGVTIGGVTVLANMSDNAPDSITALRAALDAAIAPGGDLFGLIAAYEVTPGAHTIVFTFTAADQSSVSLGISSQFAVDATRQVVTVDFDAGADSDFWAPADGITGGQVAITINGVEITADLGDGRLATLENLRDAILDRLGELGGALDEGGIALDVDTLTLTLTAAYGGAGVLDVGAPQVTPIETATAQQLAITVNNTFLNNLQVGDILTFSLGQAEVSVTILGLTASQRLAAIAEVLQGDAAIATATTSGVSASVNLISVVAQNPGPGVLGTEAGDAAFAVSLSRGGNPVAINPLQLAIGQDVAGEFVYADEAAAFGGTLETRPGTGLAVIINTDADAPAWLDVATQPGIMPGTGRAELLEATFSGADADYFAATDNAGATVPQFGVTIGGVEVLADMAADAEGSIDNLRDALDAAIATGGLAGKIASYTAELVGGKWVFTFTAAEKSSESLGISSQFAIDATRQVVTVDFDAGADSDFWALADGVTGGYVEITINGFTVFAELGDGRLATLENLRDAIIDSLGDLGGALDEGGIALDAGALTLTAAYGGAGVLDVGAPRVTPIETATEQQLAITVNNTFLNGLQAGDILTFDLGEADVEVTIAAGTAAQRLAAIAAALQGDAAIATATTSAVSASVRLISVVAQNPGPGVLGTEAGDAAFAVSLSRGGNPVAINPLQLAIGQDVPGAIAYAATTEVFGAVSVIWPGTDLAIVLDTDDDAPVWLVVDTTAGLDAFREQLAVTNAGLGADDDSDLFGDAAGFGADGVRQSFVNPDSRYDSVSGDPLLDVQGMGFGNPAFFGDAAGFGAGGVRQSFVNPDSGYESVSGDPRESDAIIGDAGNDSFFGDGARAGEDGVRQGFINPDGGYVAVSGDPRLNPDGAQDADYFYDEGLSEFLAGDDARSGEDGVRQTFFNPESGFLGASADPRPDQGLIDGGQADLAGDDPVSGAADGLALGDIANPADDADLYGAPRGIIVDYVEAQLAALEARIQGFDDPADYVTLKDLWECCQQVRTFLGDIGAEGDTLAARLDTLQATLESYSDDAIAALRAELEGLGEGNWGEGDYSTLKALSDAVRALQDALGEAGEGTQAALDELETALQAYADDAIDALRRQIEGLGEGNWGEGDYSTLKALSDAVRALQDALGEGSVADQLAALREDLETAIAEISLTPGPDGRSAYQIALELAYDASGSPDDIDTWKVGTAFADEATWIASLRGADGADGENGLGGADGKSAYQIALELAYDASGSPDDIDTWKVGTAFADEATWIASLRGADGADGENGLGGADGKSAYQIALELAYDASGSPDDIDTWKVGTAFADEATWIASLRGADGADGENGLGGADGKSAYQIALELAYDASGSPDDIDTWKVGTAFADEATWIASLRGADGANGANGLDGKSAYQIALELAYAAYADGAGEGALGIDAWKDGTDYADEAAWIASLSGASPDVTAPTIVDIALSATGADGEGVLNAGDVVTVTVTFSEAVLVTNAAELFFSLIVGTEDRFAIYAGGAGTDRLTFTYTISADDDAPDGITWPAFEVQGFALIRDAAGNAANLVATQPPEDLFPVINGPLELSYSAGSLFGGEGEDGALAGETLANSVRTRLLGHDPATVLLTVTTPLTVAQATALLEAGFALENMSFSIRDYDTSVHAANQAPATAAVLRAATLVTAIGDELANDMRFTSFDQRVSLRIEGQEGADRIDAGRGDETIVGGLGADTINLTWKDSSQDRIAYLTIDDGQVRPLTTITFSDNEGDYREGSQLRVTVNRTPYLYTVQASDTPALALQALAALVQANGNIATVRVEGSTLALYGEFGARLRIAAGGGGNDPIVNPGQTTEWRVEFPDGAADYPRALSLGETFLFDRKVYLTIGGEQIEAEIVYSEAGVADPEATVLALKAAIEDAMAGDGALADVLESVTIAANGDGNDVILVLKGFAVPENDDDAPTFTVDSAAIDVPGEQQQTEVTFSSNDADYYAGGTLSVTVGDGEGAVTVTANMVAGDAGASVAALRAELLALAGPGKLLELVELTLATSLTLTARTEAPDPLRADARMDYAGEFQRATIDLQDGKPGDDVVAPDRYSDYAVALPGDVLPTRFAPIYFEGGNAFVTITGAGPDGLFNTPDDLSGTVFAAMGEDEAETAANLADAINPLTDPGRAARVELDSVVALTLGAALGEGVVEFDFSYDPDGNGPEEPVAFKVSFATDNEGGVAGKSFVINKVPADFETTVQEFFPDPLTVGDALSWLNGIDGASVGLDPGPLPVIFSIEGGNLVMTARDAGPATITLDRVTDDDGLFGAVDGDGDPLGGTLTDTGVAPGALAGIIAPNGASVDVNGRLTLTAAVPGKETFRIDDVRLDYQGVQQIATLALDGGDTWGRYSFADPAWPDASVAIRWGAEPGIYFAGGKVYLTIDPVDGPPVVIEADMEPENGDPATYATALGNLIAAINDETRDGTGRLWGVIAPNGASENAGVITLTAAEYGRETFRIADLRMDYQGLKQIAEADFSALDTEGSPGITWFDGGKLSITIQPTHPNGAPMGRPVTITAAMVDDGDGEGFDADGLPDAAGSLAALVAAIEAHITNADELAAPELALGGGAATPAVVRIGATFEEADIIVAEDGSGDFYGWFTLSFFVDPDGDGEGDRIVYFASAFGYSNFVDYIPDGDGGFDPFIIPGRATLSFERDGTQLHLENRVESVSLGSFVDFLNAQLLANSPGTEALAVFSIVDKKLVMTASDTAASIGLQVGIDTSRIGGTILNPDDAEGFFTATSGEGAGFTGDELVFDASLNGPDQPGPVELHLQILIGDEQALTFTAYGFGNLDGGGNRIITGGGSFEGHGFGLPFEQNGFTTWTLNGFLDRLSTLDVGTSGFTIGDLVTIDVVGGQIVVQANPLYYAGMDVTLRFKLDASDFPVDVLNSAPGSDGWYSSAGTGSLLAGVVGDVELVGVDTIRLTSADNVKQQFTITAATASDPGAPEITTVSFSTNNADYFVTGIDPAGTAGRVSLTVDGKTYVVAMQATAELTLQSLADAITHGQAAAGSLVGQQVAHPDLAGDATVAAIDTDVVTFARVGGVFTFTGVEDGDALGISAAVSEDGVRQVVVINLSGLGGNDLDFIAGIGREMSIDLAGRPFTVDGNSPLEVLQDLEAKLLAAIAADTLQEGIASRIEAAGVVLDPGALTLTLTSRYGQSDPLGAFDDITGEGPLLTRPTVAAGSESSTQELALVFTNSWLNGRTTGQVLELSLGKTVVSYTVQAGDGQAQILNGIAAELQLKPLVDADAVVVNVPARTIFVTAKVPGANVLGSVDEDAVVDTVRLTLDGVEVGNGFLSDEVTPGFVTWDFVNTDTVGSVSETTTGVDLIGSRALVRDSDFFPNDIFTVQVPKDISTEPVDFTNPGFGEDDDSSFFGDAPLTGVVDGEGVFNGVGIRQTFTNPDDGYLAEPGSALEYEYLLAPPEVLAGNPTFYGDDPLLGGFDGGGPDAAFNGKGVRQSFTNPSGSYLGEDGSLRYGEDGEGDPDLYGSDPGYYTAGGLYTSYLNGGTPVPGPADGEGNFLYLYNPDLDGRIALDDVNDGEDDRTAPLDVPDAPTRTGFAAFSWDEADVDLVTRGSSLADIINSFQVAYDQIVLEDELAASTLADDDDGEGIQVMVAGPPDGEGDSFAPWFDLSLFEFGLVGQDANDGAFAAVDSADLDNADAVAALLNELFAFGASSNGAVNTTLFAVTAADDEAVVALWAHRQSAADDGTVEAGELQLLATINLDDSSNAIGAFHAGNFAILVADMYRTPDDILYHQLPT